VGRGGGGGNKRGGWSGPNPPREEDLLGKAHRGGGGGGRAGLPSLVNPRGLTRRGACRNRAGCVRERDSTGVKWAEHRRGGGGGIAGGEVGIP